MVDHFSIHRTIIELDLSRLRNSVGPIVRSGRGRASVYRYIDPVRGVSFDLSESARGDVKLTISQLARRRAVLESIIQKIERLQKSDGYGAVWVWEQLLERHQLLVSP